MFASIDVFGDAKNLTPSDDVLNANPACCQPSVELLRLLSQGLAPTFLDGRRTVDMPFGYALITTVSQLLSFGGNCQTAFL
jgi:hypothetical protein